MEILGIDPGYESMGYAICREEVLTEVQDGMGSIGRVGRVDGGIQLLEAGIISSSSRDVFSRRLLELNGGLEELFARFAIKEAAIEKIFFTPLWKSAVKVAEARGVVLTALARANVKIFEYAPTEVKRAVTGNGRSTKKTVETMVMKLCSLKTPIKEDNAADAAAIAITHCMQSHHHGHAAISDLHKERQT